MNWLPIAQTLSTLAIPVLASWLIKKFKTPTALERATLLDHIAEAAAALVKSLNPTADWATLVEQVVQQIASAAGVPTTNRAAIQRAAVLALTKLGVQPVP